MKDVVVSFRRDLTINLGNYQNAKVGAPFPSAICEEGEDPQEVYVRLKAMNLEVMRQEVIEVTSGAGAYARREALAMLGIREETPRPSPTLRQPVAEDNEDSGLDEGDGELDGEPDGDEDDELDGEPDGDEDDDDTGDNDIGDGDGDEPDGD